MIRTFLFRAFCALVAVLPAQSQLVTGKREAAPDVPAAWVVADATTGVVLESSNANRSMQIGSITKIAMAMVVLDWAAGRSENLNQAAIVPATISALSSPNSIGLEPRDEISLRDALYASLMQSDNQAAETLAVHVGRKLGGGPSEQEAAEFFTAQMNALARKLGMRETKFLNAHGLDDLERKLPTSSAGDVAKLTNYAWATAASLFTPRSASARSPGGQAWATRVPPSSAIPMRHSAKRGLMA